MKLTDQGLTLWWDTGDAPAPALEVYDSVPTSLTLAVQPPHPLHSVSVRYRVDGGWPRVLTARTTSTDYSHEIQYFHAMFPAFSGEHLVEYSPALVSAGRRVPAPPLDQRYPSSFKTIKSTPQPAKQADSGDTPRPYSVTSEFICRIEAELGAQPEVVGENPEGLRVNFFVNGGRVKGTRLNGVVHKRGVDSMLIRRDGVGVVRVRAVVETSDNVLLDADYTGLIDFGERGYERALAGKFPETADIQLAPRLITGHPKYAWLNRLQFMGVGKVFLTQNLVSYDLLAFRVGS